MILRIVLGRLHAVLVRRRQDPMPTEEDLDAAIADAFSRS